MKAELLHLLEKLKADYPDFQGVFITPNGVASAVRQHGCERFETLNALEEYAWPAASQTPTAQGQ